MKELKTTVSRKVPYVNADYIMKKFYGLSYKKQVEILFDALGNMQQYNGRSETLCIAMAMGYANDEGDYGTYYKP